MVKFPTDTVQYIQVLILCVHVTDYLAILQCLHKQVSICNDYDNHPPNLFISIPTSWLCIM